MMTWRRKAAELPISKKLWSYEEGMQLVVAHDHEGVSENELAKRYGVTKQDISELLQKFRHRAEIGDTDVARLERKRREVANDLIVIEQECGKEATTPYLQHRYAGLHDRIYHYFKGINEVRKLRDQILAERAAAPQVPRHNRARRNAEGFHRLHGDAA